MIIDLKRSIDHRWLLMSGSTYIHLKWSCWWRCDGAESEGPDREGKGQAAIWGLVSGEVLVIISLNNINFINNIETQVIIADISHNRHNRPWCTFFMPEYFLAKTLCQRERKIFSKNWLFGANLRACWRTFYRPFWIMRWCSKIEIHQVCKSSAPSSPCAGVLGPGRRWNRGRWWGVFPDAAWQHHVHASFHAGVLLKKENGICVLFTVIVNSKQ